MINSPLGTMPEGWEVKQLGEIAQQVRRNVKPGQLNTDTPCVGLEHIPRRSIALSDWSTVDEVQSSKLAFKEGEILFAKIRPYFHKVAVAPVGGVCSSDTIVISSKAAKLFSVVLSVVSSEEFVNHATQTSQGTKMPRADWSVLVKYPVAIPPPSVLHRFDDVLQSVVRQILNLIFRNNNLRYTRDLLLPKLISGEVSVEGLEIKAQAPGP
jgi:type I restriction enzyme S subunit